MKTMIQILFKIIRISLALALLLYIFHNRIFLERLPRDLNILISSTRLFIYVFIITLNIVIFSLLIYRYFFPPRNYDQLSKIGRFFVDIKNNLDVFYDLGEIYLDIILHIPKHNAFFLKISEYYFTIPLILRKSILVFLLTLPRTIVLLAFAVDVFAFHKFYYFYKVIWLLIIPLLFKFLFFVFEHVSTISYSVIMDIVDSKSMGPIALVDETRGNIKIVPLSEIRLKEGLESQFNLDAMVLEYQRICSFTYSFQRSLILNDKIHFVLGLCLRVIYIIGWSYIIFLGTNGFYSFPFNPLTLIY